MEEEEIDDNMVEKSKTNSQRMSMRESLKLLGVSKNASIDEVNKAFQDKLNEVHRKHKDDLERLVPEADKLYNAYRTVYLSKDGAQEDQMLPLTLTGPDELLNAFGISDVPHQSLKVQMQSQAQYKDGKLVKKASNKTESFINKDGKRETKIYQDGKLIEHTIDGKNMLK